VQNIQVSIILIAAILPFAAINGYSGGDLRSFSAPGCRGGDCEVLCLETVEMGVRSVRELP
jgi:hypothetical protein